MLFCHLFTIVSQHQSSSQNNLMVFELFIPFFEPGVPTRPKIGEIQLKIGQFAGKYQILVIVPQQIYRYVLTKLCQYFVELVPGIINLKGRKRWVRI